LTRNQLSRAKHPQNIDLPAKYIMNFWHIYLSDGRWGVSHVRDPNTMWIRLMISIFVMVVSLAWLGDAAAQVSQRQTAKREKDNEKPSEKPGSGKSPARRNRRFPNIYRLRLTLLDDQGRTVNEADITSSLGGEEMIFKAGGLYVIPAATVPQDRWVTIIAEKKNEALTGTTRVQLKFDANPAVIIKMDTDRSASISGTVMDETKMAVQGAHVSVAGYPGEETVTDANGQFKLAAHRAKNQMVRLYVRKEGFETSGDWQMTGDQPVGIKLIRIKP
jgi:Carboxypeptidase regulatory-like domain